MPFLVQPNQIIMSWPETLLLPQIASNSHLSGIAPNWQHMISVFGAPWWLDSRPHGGLLLFGSSPHWHLNCQFCSSTWAALCLLHPLQTISHCSPNWVLQEGCFHFTTTQILKKGHLILKHKHSHHSSSSISPLIPLRGWNGGKPHLHDRSFGTVIET